MTEPLRDAEIVSVGLATVADVARFLRVGKSTVYLLLGRGELPAVRRPLMRGFAPSEIPPTSTEDRHFPPYCL